ncbi:hypothetical protein WICMUC_002886 [Wickerhamomyces mucosus]|uniref:TRAM domain-containing protein n=1 Tax=Wickerhamomyces mucosus TaxID=1378264 RepID=A0A9P8PPB5_9ASCO|nr:hypothetical protein WICMUC_002886 [Wickerhamomyces mucosus]
MTSCITYFRPFIRHGKFLIHQREVSTITYITNFFSKINPFIPTQPPAIQPLKSQRRKRRSIDPTTSEGILLFEIQELTKSLNIEKYRISHDLIKYYKNKEHFRRIENLEIIAVSSTGKGIGIIDSEIDLNAKTIVVIPFTLKGDIVDCKIGIHQESFAEGHLLRIVKPSSSRDDSLIKCKYFNSCAGCQLQMLPYSDQLEFKTKVISNAFKQFDFNTRDLPIRATVESPLQYQYRTKLTPHFNSNRKDIKIGFERDHEGRKGIFNLNSCEIATPILNHALQENREELVKIVESYKKSGTILLRDKSIENNIDYTTNHKEIITQKINNFKFQFPAGEFFQNNNSILPSVISTISSFIDKSIHKNIIDTYCGSGFLGISLSDKVDKIIGIEISRRNLDYAAKNAQLNGLTNTEFKFGSSEEIFKDLIDLNPQESVVILDPSRKGSTEDYLNQLSNFEPDLIVYLSCNVFSQARDLKYFLKQTKNGDKYEIQLVQGFDFFPQTKHIESLVVLKHK